MVREGLVGNAAVALYQLGSGLLETQLSLEETVVAYTSIADGFTSLRQTAIEKVAWNRVAVVSAEDQLQSNIVARYAGLQQDNHGTEVVTEYELAKTQAALRAIGFEE